MSVSRTFRFLFPVLLAGLLPSLVLFLAACSASPVLKPGDSAPLFEAVDQHGNAIRLDRFRGKSNVVLYFYPKDGTPGCTAEACSLRDGYHAIEAAGAVVLGVSADSARSHEEFARRNNLPFSLLPDPHHVIIQQYGVGIPLIGIAHRTTFIIGKDGVIRTVIADARTNGHDRQVLDILKKLS